MDKHRSISVPPGVAVVVSQLGRGGAERQTVELLSGLRQSPWRPAVVVCLSEDLHPFEGHIQDCGYPIEVLPRTSSYDPRRLFRLREVLRRHGTRVVHAVHLLASGYSFLSTRGFRTTAMLPTVRGTVIEPGPFRWLIYRWMFHACPRVLANSHRGAHFIRQKFKVPDGRIRVVPNGVDFDGLRGRAGKSPYRAMLEIPQSSPLVAYVGKNSRVKNVPLFLATWQAVSKTFPDAHAVLVGNGLGERETVATLASCPPDRTHFLGPRDDVPSLLSQADVLVLTSNSEGAPNVVLEALALGTPVVSTDVGDVGRMIVHGQTGFVIQNGEPVELAMAVGQVLSQRARFHESVRADTARLKRDYSLDAMITGTVELWREIVQPSGDS